MTSATAAVPYQAHPLLRRILTTWPVVAVLDALYVTVRSAVVQRLVVRPHHAVLTGLGYGVFIWLAMNRVILPLVTYIRPAPLATLNSYLVLLSHLTVIGPPIVLLMRDRARP